MKKEKKVKEKVVKEKSATPSRLSIMFGTDRFHNTMTAVCFVTGIVWTVVYIICTFCRDAMLSKAVSDLAQKGAEEYTLIISSPMFGLLKFVMVLLPVFSILWALATVKADRNRKLLCEKRLLIAALISMGVASFTAVLDLAKIHMVFGK